MVEGFPTGNRIDNEVLRRPAESQVVTEQPTLESGMVYERGEQRMSAPNKKIARKIMCGVSGACGAAGCACLATGIYFSVEKKGGPLAGPVLMAFGTIFVGASTFFCPISDLEPIGRRRRDSLG